jgi:hypothetical protein
MEAVGGRGGIAYSFSTSALDGVSGQRYVPAALYPRGNEPPVPIGQQSGWGPEPVWTRRLEEKLFCLCQGSNLDRPVVQSIVKHYTDRTTPAPTLIKQRVYNSIYIWLWGRYPGWGSVFLYLWVYFLFCIRIKCSSSLFQLLKINSEIKET